MKDAATSSEATNSSEKPKKKLGKNAIKEATITNKRKRHSEKLEKPEIKPCSDSQKNGHNSDEKENASVSEKLNAFQFMMNSRQKSIGRNSPGRELGLDDSKEDSGKQELKARKSKLQNWAERKGGFKRKRDEEIANCINRKLEKRGKKMRKMLNIDCQSDDEVITRRKKKCPVIELDEEDTKNGLVEESEKKPEHKIKKKKTKRLSLNTHTSELPLTPNTVKAWKFKIKLCMDENPDLEPDRSSQTQNSESLAASHSEIVTVDSAAQSELQGENATQLAMNSHSEDSHSEMATVESSAQSELPDENPAKNGEFAHDSQIESKSENASLNQTEVAEVDEKESKNDNFKTENDGSLDQATEIEEETKTVDDSTLDVSVLVVEEKSENDMKRVLRVRRSKPKIYDAFLSDSDDECFEKSRKKAKKDVKMAPVFLKAKPKPKLDPKVVEARREFLMSGVPSSLKREMDRQQCVEDIEFDVFPSISHIQQKSPNNHFWNLPTTELRLSESEIDEIEIKPFSKSLVSLENPTHVTTKENVLPNKIKNCKRIVRDIKSQNPDYPVYKIFNSIYAKSGYKLEKSEEIPEKKIEKITPRRRGRPKKIPDKKSEPKMVKVDVNPDETIYALWTEKYKPKSSSDIIGNHGSILALKEWLNTWLSNANRFKNKKKTSDSESEFDVTDSDSRDSTKQNGNTVILKGPIGSGKTAAVYAVCNELDFDVLEVNASSKRTGKRLLQELQEATQSHQVCKKESSISSFVKEKEKTEKSSTKMCVLLIEDVDLVFEQDEGFTAALSQIITTSKRPIILTTTDEPYNIRRLLWNYQTFYFLPLTSILTVWLQIVCLVEGLYVHVKELDELLNYNKGDIRRTLLQLQLYVSSGGQPYKNDYQIGNETEFITENDIKMDDDNSNLSDLRLDDLCNIQEIVQIHHNCIASNRKPSSLLHCNNLAVVWWNFPAILNMPNLAKVRLERSKAEIPQQKDETDKQKLRMISDCYDSLAYADVMCGRSQFCETLQTRWRTKTTDGLGLEENMGGYRDCGFGEELALTMVTGRINAYRTKYDVLQTSFNMAVPESRERRWRSKNLSCDEKLQQALLQCDSLARKSLALDYMPYLRTITRCDLERALTNTKRGNRFYSYLKNLGVRCSETTHQLASGVFQIWD